MSKCTKIDIPTSFVLLGGTGDLAQKKLLNALMDLFDKGVLPSRFRVVAFSKDELSTEEYRTFVRNIIAGKKKTYDEKRVVEFLGLIEYVQGLFNDREAFGRIKNALEAYDTSIGMCTNKLFYLAVPPTFYDTIFEQIAHTSLDLPCPGGDGWTRILVEKPFGSDLDHAYYLEDKMSVLFREEQIYRIDHYLAKDALQNILAFRFSNGIFEDSWNKEFVESVFIRVFENFDVGTRGAFFDGVGALRDVGQNHMLQMLTLIAMDRPASLDAGVLRATRAKILSALRAPTATDIDTNIVKGQYEGYRTVQDVASGSKTETYFALKTYVDTPEWEGVPFYLEHGKAVGESKTEITVRFRSSKNCVCDTTEPHDHPNFVKFTISPDQRITVRFWVRKPGSKYELEPNDLVFDRTTTLPEGTALAEAYEEVLFDGICGDQTLFVSNAEQEAAWKYVTSILKLWKDVEPRMYASGSSGPESDLIKEVTSHMSLAD
jgi:glucose-6-phosphate 1-dehydrogenase